MLDRQIVEEAARSGFSQAQARKVEGPLIDVHTHAAPVREAAHLFRAAEIYGVRQLVVIGRLEAAFETQERFPGRVSPAVSLDYTSILADPERFIRENVARVHRAADRGGRVVKFWFTPRFYAQVPVRLDDQRLVPVFEAIEARGMAVLVHVSDPDRWFERVYTDPALYGTKAEQYPQLENTLARFRRTPFIAAHMGGDPEHLDHLAELLEAHPNLHLDTSATKWMVRELGRKPEESRAFFERFADRLLFGTDQVVTEGSDLERYTVRYWIHQMMWETAVRCPLPIEDPDADGDPVLQGIDLPPEVLRKVYWENAAQLLGLA